jgi:hypothetical protein
MFDVVVASGRKPAIVPVYPPARAPTAPKAIKWPRWPARRKARAAHRG